MIARDLLIAAVWLSSCALAAGAGEESGSWIEMPAAVLEDKVYGGLLGQILGNLNGLPYEMEYIQEPGHIEQYVPGLPEGARTDDDTDLEWMYVCAIQRSPTLLLPAAEITALWKRHVNQGVWCANHYARQLMDLGIEPPLSGQPAVNPWSDFNISGQFVCETFGLIAPAMPRAAAQMGLHYTRVAIDGEPAQATQLFTAMIATAFVSSRIDEILDAGAAAVDRQSAVARIVAEVRKWHSENPRDWRATRDLVQKSYSRAEGAMRDRNGYELNTASTVAALLYGQGDFVATLRTAFNFGWDADNNAATAGTILGVIRGRRWIEAQGWVIADRYQNTSRPGMPEDETISRFAERIAAVAERVILGQGGEKKTVDGRTVYRIRRQTPANVLPLADPAAQFAEWRARLKPEIEAALAGEAPVEQKARAVYLAICFDLAEPLRRQAPDRWTQAVEALQQYPGLLAALADSPTPAAAELRKRAAAVGVGKGKTREEG